MFGFLEKPFQKPLPKDLSELEVLLAEAQEKGDQVRLVQACYGLGVYYMNHGEPARAQMWLNRADTIFSARDDVFSKVGKALREDCSERLGALEDEDIFPNNAVNEIEEQLDELDPEGKLLWGLMSLARLVQVGRRLAALPGCEILGALDRASQLLTACFCEEHYCTTEEVSFLSALCSELYELDGTEAFSNMTQTVPVPGGAPMQAFDLNGLLTLTELYLFLDGCYTILTEGSGGVETGLIACTLLPDYYLRTCRGEAADLPQVQAERGRIRSDFAFLQAGPDRETAAARIAAYRELDILAE